MAGKRELTSSKETPKPLPKYLKDHKKVHDEYSARLEEFKDYCVVLKGDAKDQKGGYRKNYVENLKKAADSYHVMNKGRFKSYPVEVREYFREKMAEVIVEMKMLPVFCDHVKELLPAKPKDSTARNVLDWCLKPIMNSCYYLADATRIVVRHPGYLQTVAKFIRDVGEKPEAFWKDMHQYALYQILNISRVDDNSEKLLEAGFESILAKYTESPLSHHRLAALATLANIVDEDETTETAGASKETSGTDPAEASKQDPKTEPAKQASETDTTEPAKQKISKTSVYKTSTKSIDFLMGKIKDASSNNLGISDGWPLTSLLEVVGNLARNDHNSRLLVQRGCLSYLAKLANTGDLEAETIAAKSLESLAFNEENAADMVTLKEFDLLVILGDLSRAGRDEVLRFHASGALFTLKEKLKKTGQHTDKVKQIEKIIPHGREKLAKAARPVKQEESMADIESVTQALVRLDVTPISTSIICQETQQPDGSIVRSEQGRLQVMLSYNREHRDKVQQISWFLLEKGFKVWIDTNDMTGDTYQAMANAVETSDIICICFSRAYKKSKYCQREAEYADSLDKPLVPLKMANYDPRGWLGFIIKPLVYVDFTGKYPEEDMRDKLLRELANTRKKKQDSSDDEKPGAVQRK